MAESHHLKKNRLKDLLDSMGSLLVSFSGGMDSTFLLFAASETLNRKVAALTFISPLFPKRELARAEQLAKKINVEHVKVSFDIVSCKDFQRNDSRRCYICKTKMVEQLKREAAKRNLVWIADGSNVDDLDDYRPGLEAAREGGLRSPLLEIGFTKADIRKQAKENNMEAWNIPSSACLASRIPYGTPITEHILYKIELAEDFLRQLGFQQVRVRYHDAIARIEIFTQDISRFADSFIRQKVSNKLKELGFTYVTLDLSGYMTGSMNALL